jgi:hypothetical protein
VRRSHAGDGFSRTFVLDYATLASSPATLSIKSDAPLAKGAVQPLNVCAPDAGSPLALAYSIAPLR